MKQYDIFLLQEDVNSVIRKGMEGVILEIYDSTTIEVEFVWKDGGNIVFEECGTFQINPQIIEVKTAYNKR